MCTGVTAGTSWIVAVVMHIRLGREALLFTDPAWLCTLLSTKSRG